MADGQYTSEFRLTFPDEKTRDDFEVAFRAWLKQYQRQNTLQNMIEEFAALANRIGGQPGGQRPGGLQPGGQPGQGGSGGHSYGQPQPDQGQGQAQGLHRETIISGSEIIIRYTDYIPFF